MLTDAGTDQPNRVDTDGSVTSASMLEGSMSRGGAGAEEAGCGVVGDDAEESIATVGWWVAMSSRVSMQPSSIATVG